MPGKPWRQDPEPWICEAVMSWPSMQSTTNWTDSTGYIQRGTGYDPAFSCYIWNIEYVRCWLMDLGKYCRMSPYGWAGPEVSLTEKKCFRGAAGVTGIMKGGRETFAQLAGYYVDKCAWKKRAGWKTAGNGLAGPGGNIPGLAFRLPEEFVANTGIRTGPWIWPDTISI